MWDLLSLIQSKKPFVKILQLISFLLFLLNFNLLSAGQLLKEEKYAYSYDEVGNLIEKQSIAGTWKYRWSQGGMLKQVVRPDNKKVDFTYDALGRRLTKTFKGETTHFVWDGNVPLHEWTSSVDETISTVNEKGETEITIPENLTTWIFEDGTFIPMAKLQGDKSYSIITDHLGTLTEAYDEEGEKVWTRELGIYGQTRKESGVENFIPFAYAGQYQDIETGLSYNRFRYYSPESGTYISQDPIGLGGQMPNFYAYVLDSNSWIDPFGLEMVTVYHFTSAEGAKGISGNGVINASDPGARGVGAINKSKGVYVTKVKPADLQKSGLRGQMGLTKTKSTHYVEFQIDDSKLKKLDPQDSVKRLRIDEDVHLRGANNKLKDGVSIGKTPCK